MVGSLFSWIRARASGSAVGALAAEPLVSGDLSAKLDEAIEASRKSAKLVMRLDARVGALAEQVEAVGAGVRALVASGERAEAEFWAPLMDALDRLDAARNAVEAGQVEGAGAGLQAIGARLEELLARAGYERHGERGVPVDGRLHRVVGTLSLEGRPEGSVARVVRAPVTQQGRIVRIGEVIAVKNAEVNGRMTGNGSQ